MASRRLSRRESARALEEFRAIGDLEAMTDRARLRLMQTTQQGVDEFARLLGATIVCNHLGVAIANSEGTICTKCGEEF